VEHDVCLYSTDESLGRGLKLLPMYTVEQRGLFSFVNTGKQVHLKHARRHFERNLVKDVHHRSFASRIWLIVIRENCSNKIDISCLNTATARMAQGRDGSFPDVKTSIDAVLNTWY